MQSTEDMVLIGAYILIVTEIRLPIVFLIVRKIEGIPLKIT